MKSRYIEDLRVSQGTEEFESYPRQSEEDFLSLELTAVYLKAPEGGYVAFVDELPGANTQGESLEEARENLREAVGLILGANCLTQIEPAV